MFIAGKAFKIKNLQVADERARLNRIKAPHAKKAAIIRARKTPKAMY